MFKSLHKVGQWLRYFFYISTVDLVQNGPDPQHSNISAPTTWDRIFLEPFQKRVRRYVEFAKLSVFILDKTKQKKVSFIHYFHIIN